MTPVSRFRSYGEHHLRRLRELSDRRPSHERGYAIRAARKQAKFWYTAASRVMACERARAAL